MSMDDYATPPRKPKRPRSPSRSSEQNPRARSRLLIEPPPPLTFHRKRRPEKMARRRYRRSSGRGPVPDAWLVSRRNAQLNQYDKTKARGSEYSVERYGHTAASAGTEQRKNRVMDNWKGSGDYSSWKPWLQRWVPKGTLAAIGGGLGGMVGMGGFGSALGSSAASYLGWGKYRRRKNYRGRGDYGGSVGGNQIMGGSVDTPMTVNASDDLSGDIFISHREFLGNVTALGTGTTTPSAFNLVSYPLNVGLPTTFPWLSQIAQNFSLYELQGCIFEYKPTSGELGSASNALGKVVMATQYDPDQANFGSTIEMENYDYNIACKPSEHAMHGVETANSQRATQMLYVRTGNSSKSKIFTDIGTFQIATEGLPVNVASGTIVNVGELWVTYRVRLSRALLYGSLLGSNISHDVLLAWASGTNIAGNTLTQLPSQGFQSFYNSATSATHFATKKTNSIGVAVRGTASDTLQCVFPANIITGTFLVQITLKLPAPPAAGYSIGDPIGLVNCSLVTVSGLTAAIVKGTDTAATLVATTYTCKFYLRVAAPGTNQAVFNVGMNAVPVANVITYVEITEANAAALT